MAEYDIKAYLEDRGIDYHVEGEKNVSRGWVGIRCIFPFCHDQSWHLGINLEAGTFSCFKCGEKGRFPKLIEELENVDWKQAKKIARRFLGDAFADRGLLDSPSTRSASPRSILQETTRDFPKLHWKYLKRRKFDPEFLIKKYRLEAVYTTGRYAYRIIVPVFFGRKMVSFTGLDVTGKAAIKYKHSRKDESILHPKEVMYNLDTVKRGGTAVVVEGVTDVWRIGDGCVGTFGKQWTKEQVDTLLSCEPERAIVLLDSDANRQARKLANYLSGVVSTEKWTIDRDDPDKLDHEYIVELRREIDAK